MNDPDNFLTRWSRRKRQVADESAAPPSDERERGAADALPTERAADAAPPARPQAVETNATEPAFDLSKLPPVESITAETDIRAFLAPGVPADVRLAALRRAWVADPKVRDFVGLADYDFDFHTPGAIPGFGPLEMTDELRREVVRIVSAWQPAPEADGPAAAEEPVAAAPADASPAQPVAAIEEINTPSSSKESAATPDPGAGTDQPAPDQDEVIAAEETEQRNKVSAASQQQHSQPEDLQTLARRGHGRALPK
jgi:Protein of unknown function (DUF3306)